MDIADVRRVLIVGSGTMGLRIGLQFATHGFDVALYDIEPAALDDGRRRLEAYADEVAATGRIGRRRTTAPSAGSRGRPIPQRQPPKRTS